MDRGLQGSEGRRLETPQSHDAGTAGKAVETYDNCVVLKPWGYEFQVFDNGRASVWLLNINPGQGTSIHCHYGKRATFLPLDGVIGCRTNDGFRYLSFADVMRVDRYEFHSVCNPMHTTGATLLEIEAPSDKSDLMRLRDNYGRGGKGYEGGDKIIRSNLEEYGYFSLKPFSSNWFGRFLIFMDDEELCVERMGWTELVRVGLT